MTRQTASVADAAQHQQAAQGRELTEPLRQTRSPAQPTRMARLRTWSACIGDADRIDGTRYQANGPGQPLLRSG